MDLVVIGFAALATSILSAVAGLGGGTILLAVIAQFFAPTVAIPIQGAIQFASNGSRAVMLRSEVSWPAVGWTSLLLLPAAFLGVAIATSIPEAGTRLLLASFVLIVAWRPGLLKRRGGDRLPNRAMLGVGAASGLLNTTVGVSGPVASPFIKAVTTTHVAFVATAAATQVLAHTAKLIAFSAADFAIGDHLGVIGIGAAGVMAGSWLGTRLLGRASEQDLDVLFKVVLTVLAARLIWQSLSSI